MEVRPDSDVYIFLTKDRCSKIEIVIPVNGDIHYNITRNAEPESLNLSHREVITTYYDPADSSDFGITLMKACDMYLSLTE